MDLYTFLLFLGAAGLATMALQGIGGGHAGHGHGHGGDGGHGLGGAGHGHDVHVGSGHGGHAGHAGHAGHGGHGGHGGHAGHAGHGHHAGDQAARADLSHEHGGIGHTLLSFVSPRVLFSVCLGAGAMGPFLRPLMGNGALLVIASIGGGIIFERVIVTPIWNFAFRFASKPALMLESCIDDEGTAVTSFDKNGQGLIAVDLDGQVVQLLATLRSDDRQLGAAVRAGDRVRIADVNSARNSCTVSVL